MFLHVIHTTCYHYSPAVESAHHLLHLKPANCKLQRLLRYALHIEPKPQLREATDVYGNTLSYVALQGAHKQLTVVADSIVATSAAQLQLETDQPSAPWEQVRKQFRYRAAAAYDSASEFLFASPYIPRDEAFIQFAQTSFSAGRPLAEAAHDLMQRIHAAMVYESKSTEVNTPALDALKQGKGVCQDFAHIMVACCRAMGVPARYVSGYLLTTPPAGQPRLIGSDSSHAWASVYCPNLAHPSGRWLDFDPTNNREPGEDYVRLAIGRDFLDVSPMRGVIRGGARHRLDVAVTVKQLDSLPESVDFSLSGSA